MPHSKLLYNFNPLPEQVIQEKFRYFYEPYNPKVNYKKHMEYEDQESNDETVSKEQKNTKQVEESDQESRGNMSAKQF